MKISNDRGTDKYEQPADEERNARRNTEENNTEEHDEKRIGNFYDRS